MTLLLSWIGKDSRKISSFYIASDSRLSWSNGAKYNYGRKVFALSNSPDILGYCGDVLYPTLILNHILEMDRAKMLFGPDIPHYERSKILFQEIQRSFSEYPSASVMRNSCEILHVSRQGKADFLCNVFRWTQKSGWTIKSEEIPNTSDKVIILGSGAKEFYQRYQEYRRGLNGETSRAIFQCLTNTLLKIKDLQCGGPPQLVGLFNRLNGENFGTIYAGKRYYLGREIKPSDIYKDLDYSNIEWRNELFERCDGSTTKILNGAQRQPDELRP